MTKAREKDQSLDLAAFLLLPALCLGGLQVDGVAAARPVALARPLTDLLLRHYPVDLCNTTHNVVRRSEEDPTLASLVWNKSCKDSYINYVPRPAMKMQNRTELLTELLDSPQ